MAENVGYATWDSMRFGFMYFRFLSDVRGPECKPCRTTNPYELTLGYLIQAVLDPDGFNDVQLT